MSDMRVADCHSHIDSFFLQSGQMIHVMLCVKVKGDVPLAMPVQCQ